MLADLHRPHPRVRLNPTTHHEGNVMGYHTAFHGGLTIEPPLTWPEIQSSPSWAGHPNQKDRGFARDFYGAHLHVTEETVETDQGTLIRRQCALVTIEGDELREDPVLNSLRRLALDFGATHKFVGTILAEGDENDDIWRIQIEGTSVVRVEPVILWPGDEKAETIVATTLRRTLGIEWPDEALMVARRVLYDLTDLNRRK